MVPASNKLIAARLAILPQTPGRVMGETMLHGNTDQHLLPSPPRKRGPSSRAVQLAEGSEMGPRFRGDDEEGITNPAVPGSPRPTPPARGWRRLRFVWRRRGAGNGWG